MIVDASNDPSMYICIYLYMFSYFFIDFHLLNWLKSQVSLSSTNLAKDFRSNLVALIFLERYIQKQGGRTCHQWTVMNTYQLQIPNPKIDQHILVGGLEHFFPYIGNNHPNWLIFFRGVETTNQDLMPWFWSGWMLHKIKQIISRTHWFFQD